MKTYRSIEWLDDIKALRLLDQTALPGRVTYLAMRTVDDVANAIKTMIVRGAPAIGVTAAYGMALAAATSDAKDLAPLEREMRRADALLRASRPTAVNLFWALDKVSAQVAAAQPLDVDGYRRTTLTAAHAIAEADVAINIAIGKAAARIVPDNATFIHHCNTGSIATMDYGTALGVIRIAHESGKRVRVFVDETRPRLQGARLTAWELGELGIPYQLIVDGASGHVMRHHKVDMCLVGCDRVAINGDVANKIGTYNLAVVAKANDVPFYVCAPLSTIDPSTARGEDIEIECRGDDEICVIDGQRIAPPGSPTYNPAFDVTPAHLITGIITENGIVYPPFEPNLKSVLSLKES